MFTSNLSGFVVKQDTQTKQFALRIHLLLAIGELLLSGFNGYVAARMAWFGGGCQGDPLAAGMAGIGRKRERAVAFNSIRC